MIDVERLSKKFVDRYAVEEVSFRVEEGEIVGFLGPNGAGKTTTMRMITGFLAPTSGSVRVGGVDIAKRPLEVKRQIGYLPESIALYPEMRAHEYLLFRAAVEGVPRRAAQARLDEVIERCLLADVREQIVGNLSKGYRQRVGLAAALIHNPRILIFDEPTVGMDPRQIIKIRQLIKDLGRDHTILLSTHILPEVELVCDRVVIIDGGRVVAEDATSNLRARVSGGGTLMVVLRDAPEDDVREALAAIPGATTVTAERRGEEQHFRVASAAQEDLRAEAARTVASRGWTLLELYPERLSLEDVFVRLTTREVAAPNTDVDEGAGDAPVVADAAAPAAPAESEENA